SSRDWRRSAIHPSQTPDRASRNDRNGLRRSPSGPLFFRDKPQDYHGGVRVSRPGRGGARPAATASRNHGGGGNDVSPPPPASGKRAGRTDACGDRTSIPTMKIFGGPCSARLNGNIGHFTYRNHLFRYCSTSCACIYHEGQGRADWRDPATVDEPIWLYA